MNKQKLIEKYEEKYETIFGFPVIRLNQILEDLKQLDEPQKVKVPQVVADYIEYAKENDWDLQEAMDSALIASEDDLEFSEWFYKENNMEILALAWINGYTVEEEKQYYVRFKFIEDSYSYLTLIKHLDAWTLHSITLDKKFRTKHTKKQLEEAGFGEVFNSTLFEVKEVEE